MANNNPLWSLRQFVITAIATILGITAGFATGLEVWILTRPDVLGAIASILAGLVAAAVVGLGSARALHALVGH